MICDEHVSTVELLNLPSSLVVTGKIPILTEVCNGLQILRTNLKTMHEEGDLSFLKSSIDTDALVLLVHYDAEKKLTSTLLMEPTIQGRSSAHIGYTVAAHRSLAPQLHSAHALSWCDNFASYFGIGKTNVVKILEAENRLNYL